MSYKVGDKVTGTVSGVTAYGAFVTFEDGANGMIHISKLSKGFITDINSVIKKGDVVTATVISTDNGKIALSLIGDEPKRPPRNDRFSPNKRSEPQDFEAMLSSFKSVSEEKLSGLNRSNERKRRR